MASGPIISWQIDGETVSEFIFGGSKITADCDCRHEIKRRLLLGRKVMTNLHSVLKSRDTILPTKVHLVKAMVFPVVMYGYESWTVKKPEHWRIDAFELWCWRRLFFFYFILLYNTVLVLPYIDMNPPRVYMSSQTWTPPPTSHPISSLWIIPVHQPQASCILHKT